MIQCKTLIFLVFTSQLFYTQSHTLNGFVSDSISNKTISMAYISLWPINYGRIRGFSHIGTHPTDGKYILQNIPNGVYKIMCAGNDYRIYEDTISFDDSKKDVVKNFYLQKLTYIDTTINGIYLRSFERSTVKPCGSNELWWVDDYPTEFKEKYYSLPQDTTAYYGNAKAFVIVKGKRSEKGRFGHLSAFKYRFIIEKVIELRLANENECK